jgi:hypothetical protein
MTPYQKLNITGSRQSLFTPIATEKFTAKQLLDALSLNHDYQDGMKMEFNAHFPALRVTIPKYESQGFDFASLILFRLCEFKKTSFAQYKEQITVDSSSTYISNQALNDLTEFVAKRIRQVSFSDNIEIFNAESPASTKLRL